MAQQSRPEFSDNGPEKNESCKSVYDSSMVLNGRQSLDKS